MVALRKAVRSSRARAFAAFRALRSLRPPRVLSAIGRRALSARAMLFAPLYRFIFRGRGAGSGSGKRIVGQKRAFARHLLRRVPDPPGNSGRSKKYLLATKLNTYHLEPALTRPALYFLCYSSHYEEICGFRKNSRTDATRMR